MAVSNAVKEALTKTFDTIVEFGKKSIPKDEAGSWLFNYTKEGHRALSVLPETHLSLKKRWAIGIPVGIALIQGGVGVAKLHDDSKLGEMQGDQLSNTVNITQSPTLDKFLKDRDPEQSDPKDIARITNDRRTPLQLRTGNASGDLVFALHNLRNGGE